MAVSSWIRLTVFKTSRKPKLYSHESRHQLPANTAIHNMAFNNWVQCTYSSCGIFIHSNTDIMIKVQFKSPINGETEVVCVGVSSDLIRPEVFLLQLEGNEIIEIYYKRIKHISSCK